MNIEFSAVEARVMGCLIEKQITTPDQYPLSLNALTNACNQKSNRDPVLDLNERVIQQTLDGLVRKHLVIERSGFGSRVPKYQHVFCNTEFGSLKFTTIETAIVCELLLRGAQTPGELRGRANRMSEISDVAQIEGALQSLAGRDDGPFVVRLAKEPGRRDSRYMHLFCGAVTDEHQGAGDQAVAEERGIASATPPVDGSRGTPLDEDRLNRLEALVETLCRDVATLKNEINK